MNLMALDSIVRFGFSRRRHGADCHLFNINTSWSERSIDYVVFSVRNETNIFSEISEWLGGVCATRHWVHDVLSSISVSP